MLPPEPTGTAFLLFGNDVAEGARDAYEIWHGGHHVPQRLTVPGLLGAIRYRASGDARPEYLTFYRLAHAGIVAEPAYRRLVEHPDPETLAMRPNLRRPVRRVASVTALPRVPPGAALRVFRGAPPMRPFGTLIVTGRIETDAPEHPLTAEAVPDSGRLTLVFGPVTRLNDLVETQAHPVHGLFLPIGSYGFDAASDALNRR